MVGFCALDTLKLFSRELLGDMLHSSITNTLEKCFCIGLKEAKKEEWFVDDGKWHFMKRFDRNIILCGRRRSYFPFHCHVGPDWPMIILVYFLVIFIDGIVLWAIHEIGYPTIIIGGIGTVIVLISYTATACTDPGMIYETDYSKPMISNTTSSSGRDIEMNDNSLSVSSRQPSEASNELLGTVQKTPSGLPVVPPISTIECGNCHLQRPYSSHHCHYCKTCVDRLDHHCPWCGKCIGKENLNFFHVFLFSLSLQFYFLIASSIYYAISVYVSAVPQGPQFK